MDEKQPQQTDRQITIFLTILLAFIIIVAVVVFAYSNGFFLNGENNDGPTYTKSFLNITAKEAYNLINITENLTVIDCRGLEGCSTCQFNKGHLPGAELNDNPTTLYQNESDYKNTTDILVYSVNGSVGVNFCSDLLGHVYGKIYNLDGGYEAWVAAGYPIK
jgi:rhodanese-related sulfurtransferase